MSEPIEKLLQRIAVLEHTLAEQKKPAAPAYDNADPLGSLQKLGADVPFLTKLLVAQAMGDQAPPELRALQHLGPQISATRALESKLEDLSRQVTGVVTSSQKKAARESFRALTTDKSKYPALAWALAADPELLNEELDAHQGSAEEFAAKMETRFSKLAPKEAPPPASEENAETTERSDSVMGLPQAADEVAADQSAQVESAHVEAPPPAKKPLNGRMPPLAPSKPGVFTQDEHERLKAEVLRKFS